MNRCDRLLRTPRQGSSQLVWTFASRSALHHVRVDPFPEDGIRLRRRSNGHAPTSI